MALGSGRSSFPPRPPAPRWQQEPNLYALWKQLPGRCSKRSHSHSPMEQLRDLLLRLSQDWQKYYTFQSEPLVPWTSKATEHSIGRMKPVLSLSKGCEPVPSGATNPGQACSLARSHCLSFFTHRLCDGHIKWVLTPILINCILVMKVLSIYH